MVDEPGTYDGSLWFEHSNAYAFFDEDGGEATAEHPAPPAGDEWIGGDEDEEDCAEGDGPDPIDGDWDEPEPGVDEPPADGGTEGFVFVAAATRYALDLTPLDAAADRAPEAPPAADVSDPDDDAWTPAASADGEQSADLPAGPATHHGGHGARPRKVHARHRKGGQASKRRAALAALVLTGVIAGTAMALGGPGSGTDNVADRAPTTDGSRDELPTAPSTFRSLTDLSEPGVSGTTTPVTAPTTLAPTTVAPATTSTTRVARVTATTTAPATAPTTTFTPTTLPPFTTTTAPATTSTTRSPSTTTTTAPATTTTTTTSAPATTTTTAPTTTTTTTTQPPTTPTTAAP